MSKTVDLWVCPNCDILKGIEVQFDKESNVLSANCVNCGMDLSIDDVGFIDPELAKSIIKDIEIAISEDLNEEIRYSWVSNKTVGIIFEFPREELEAIKGTDFIEFIEDELAKKYDLTLTVYFE